MVARQVYAGQIDHCCVVHLPKINPSPFPRATRHAPPQVGPARPNNRGGNYYNRGLQVGKAIAAAWPNASVRMVYGYPWPGLVAWVQGHADAGLQVKVGLEHTYGAGPCTPASRPWYACSWGGMNTSAAAAAEAVHWPFAHSVDGGGGGSRGSGGDSAAAGAGVRRAGGSKGMSAGLFPLCTGETCWSTSGNHPTAMYTLCDFEVQLRSALCDDVAPIATWLWLAGRLTQASLANISGAGNYTALMHTYSSHNTADADLCALPRPLCEND